MRKFRIVIWAITIILAVAVAAGAVVLIISPDSAFETAFNIIAFSISATSVAIAVMSQVSAYKDRQKISKLVHGMSVLDEEMVQDEKAVEHIQRKLNEIVALDTELNRKIDRLEKKAHGKSKK
ncbi:MAG: hypothetical protein ACK5MU_01585 [Candidatus Saccharimonadales bacterium]